MKKLKLMVAAIAMICLSTVATITGTVAWFAANRTVDVKGIHIKAKSDADYLEISTIPDGSWSKEVNAGIGSDTASQAVLPCAHDDFGSKDNVNVVSKWYYGYSADDNVSTIDGDKIYLNSSSTFTNYVISKDFYFRVKDETESVDKDLHIKSITFTANTGLAAVFVGTDDFDEYNVTVTNNSTGKALINTVDYVANSSASDYKVTAYFYIDGNNEDVKTANFTTLDGDIEITFSATPGSRTNS